MSSKTDGLKARIRTGKLTRTDVARRLAELAYGQCNDCVRLVMETAPDLEQLDLSLLTEIRRNDKGMVEVRLLDRLKVLEQLALLTQGDNPEMDAFLRALQGGGQ